MSTLPHSMVLVYQPELKCSVWVDYHSKARTIKGLERQLRAGVKDGICVAWRLIRIKKEVMGNGE